ncbi:hypothetical protein BDF22DRAFT_701030 [Syncephalis plumigaleata]|nr:hypothetical protein BDF22DRAFT_701030 [Syncephalis plumigaleata]
MLRQLLHGVGAVRPRTTAIVKASCSCRPNTFYPTRALSGGATLVTRKPQESDPNNANDETASLSTTEMLTRAIEDLSNRPNASSVDSRGSSFGGNRNSNNPYNIRDNFGRAATADPSAAAAESSAKSSSMMMPDAHMHILYVNATPNNTMVTLTENNGRVLISSSGGTAGFRKAQRSGPEAAYQATQQLINKASERGIKVSAVHLKLNGFGPGREAVYRALRVTSDWDLIRISDATPIPFNGCRPRKKRRL